MERIAFIGAGNVAWHLAPALESAGCAVVSVYSRDPANAQALCDRLAAARPQDHLYFAHSVAQTFILCVPDGAFSEVLADLRLPEGANLLHTSGSQPLDALRPSDAQNLGVFYPLQTFSKAKPVDFSKIPFCLECENPDILRRMERWAERLSPNVQRIGSAQRQILHVAAVIACNFSNHLFAVADDVLQREGLSFDLLRPLLEETVQKALLMPPKDAQTGPARRGDRHTADCHQAYLDEKTPYKRLYEVLTASIRQMHGLK